MLRYLYDVLETAAYSPGFCLEANDPDKTAVHDIEEYRNRLPEELGQNVSSANIIVPSGSLA